MRSKLNMLDDTIVVERAQCEDPKVIIGWFDCLQQTQMQYGISYEDIYILMKRALQWA
jgi:hypothetical protein